MKVTVNVECTPEEARAFMGLPDVQPMQERVMKEMEDRMTACVRSMGPESVIQTWLPAGIQGADQLHRMFWSQVKQAMTGMADATGNFARRSEETENDRMAG